VPDDLAQEVFQTGQCVTVIETRDGQRMVRRLTPLKASQACAVCHDAAPGEILGVLDASFDLEKVQSPGPDFYRNLLLVSLLVSIILVLLVFLIFSRINMARRIEGVTDLAGDIAAGDFERRVPALPGARTDGLARVINEMAKSLQTHEAALGRQQRELEEANRRLEVLVQESHHRIKNNLQTVADLLSLQAVDCPAGGNSCMKDSIQRVKSIAAVHELLSVEQSESTDVQKLAERLLQMAIRNAASPGQHVRGTIVGDNVRLASKQATALALVLSEVLNNALIHGLADRAEGQIAVNVQARDRRVVLSVRDSGQGLPDDFTRETHEQLGLRIVHTLVRRELKGEFSLQSNSDGAIATIIFPHSVIRET
jgi:two-component sensor histidine kinase